MTQKPNVSYSLRYYTADESFNHEFHARLNSLVEDSTHQIMRNSVLRAVFLFISSTASVVSALGTNAFTWRGNVLKLKDAVEIETDRLPFNLNKLEESLNVAVVDANSDDNGYPLLPEARIAFPGHRQLVFSNEMKFRELMSDSRNLYSNELIRCQVDQSGGIERIGLFCRIIQSKYLRNGQAMYIIESLKRIQIGSMTVKAGKSYLSSTKTEVVDVESLTITEINLNEKLSNIVFERFTNILRLAKLRIEYGTKLAGIEFNVDLICLSPELVAHRPGQKDFLTNSQAENMARHDNFSFAAGNYLSASHMMVHSMLASNTYSRLCALSEILDAATITLNNQISEMTRDLDVQTPLTTDQKSADKALVDLKLKSAFLQKILDLHAERNPYMASKYEDLLPPVGQKGFDFDGYRYDTDIDLDLVLDEDDDDDEFVKIDNETDDDIMQ